MLILSLHSGPHDSSAALFDDYRVLAAVAEERRNIDVLVCTRGFFRRRYFTYWRPHERLREGLRRVTGNEKTREMNVVVGKLGRRADELFDAGAFLADLGLRPDARLFFANHHFAHALPSLFFTDWDEALLYTADGSGDQVYYSHNLLRDGTLTNLYGDDRWLGRAHPSGSLGLAYGFVTEALGFRMNRHEGKLTGLAAYGEPTLLTEMQRHFRVTEDGRIEMDLADDGALRERFRALAASETRE